jgi:hypothetical protein
MTDAPPVFFERILVELLGTSRRLAREVWRYYPASTELIFQLNLCASPAQAPDVTIARMKHAADLLSPQCLLRSVERLAAGKARKEKELVRLEDNILRLLDIQGRWKWYAEERKERHGQRPSTANRL